MKFSDYMRARKDPPRPPGTLAYDVCCYVRGNLSDWFFPRWERVLDRIRNVEAR